MSRNEQRLARRMEPKFVKRRQRGLAVLIASFVLIIGAIVYIGGQILVGDKGGSRTDFEGTGNGVTQLIQVPEGSSISELGPDLVDKGVVKSDEAFQTAAANNVDAGSLQPGFYRLQEEMSADSAVKALLDLNNQVDLLDVQEIGRAHV